MTQSSATSNGRALSRTEQLLRAFHEEDAQQSYDLGLLRFLWRFMVPHKHTILLSLLAGAAGVTLSLMLPQIVRYMIDQGAVAGNGTAVTWGGLGLVACAIAKQLASFGQAFLIQMSGAKSVGTLRETLFQFLQTLRLGYFDRTPVGRLVTRITNDTDAILELFSSGAFSAFTDLLQLIAIVCILLWMDPTLSLVAFAAAPPAAIIVRLVRRKAREAFRTIRAKTARMNATMNEQVIGMAVVQAFGQQRAMAEEFDEINAAYRDANINAIKYEAVQDAAIDMVQGICGASIVVALGFHQVSVGTLFAFNMYVMMFFEPISALAQRYTLLQRALSGAERVAKFLETNEPDSPSHTPPLRAAAAAGSPSAVAPALELARARTERLPALEFCNVDFRYKPQTPTLSSVSFRIEQGQKVALVGPTGAGKTTVASLALGLYEAQAGDIRVLGRDLARFDRHELRRLFSVVPQDVFLFPGSLASNIAIGDRPDLGRVEAALQRIGAYDLFSERPGGLQAEIEEMGANFSQGERQLIALARAVYRDSPLLILDEATASVDSHTEARLQRALDESLKERTALIIAHRLSTIRTVDRILVFHRGQLVEQGTHAELLAQQGLYARLYQLHFSRERLEQHGVAE